MFFKKHPCEKCGSSFRKVEELMHHKQIAHEPKEYECRQCGSSFGGMEQMREHAKRMHSYKRAKTEKA